MAPWRRATITGTATLIARLCLRHDIALYTLDGHFRRIPGLRLFGPE